MGWFRGFGVPRCRGSLVGFTLLVAISLSEGARGQELVVPVVLSGELPWYPQIAGQAKLQGTVKLRVTTDGERVSAVEIISHAPMLDMAAFAAVKTWRFASHRATTFETTVRFGLAGPLDSCFPTKNPRWTHKLPFEVLVEGGEWGCIIDGPPLRTSEVRTLQGVVRCDCPGQAPIPNAVVEVRANEQVRTGTTNKQGRFNLSNVQPDRYQLTVTAPGFDSQSVFVKVSPSSDDRDAEFILVPSPPAQPEIARFPVRLTAAEVITYPQDARSRGVEGVVRLLVHPDGAVAVLAGAEVLATAAVESARAWKYKSTEGKPTEVRFRYVLVGDCGINQNPTVDLTLPEVVITATRLVGCKNLPSIAQ